MKLNNKGFMMAEVIIVSAVAIIIMVSMYESSSKMIKLYEVRDNYYNVDTIYATGYVYNYLIDNYKINDYLIELESNSSLASIDLAQKDDDYINDIILKFDLNKVLLVKNSLIDNVSSDSSLKKTMRTYLDGYVSNNIINNNGYSIVIERKKNGSSSDYYYYFIEL